MDQNWISNDSHVPLTFTFTITQVILHLGLTTNILKQRVELDGWMDLMDSILALTFNFSV